MAKKKTKSILKPLILLIVSVLMLVMFFLPWMSYTGKVLGMEGKTSNISGLDSVVALFTGDEKAADLSGSTAAAYILKKADDTSAAFGTNATCWLILAIVSAVTAVFSLLALLSRKKVAFGKLLALAMLVLAVIVLICSITVVSKSGGEVVGTGVKTSIHMASILAAILGLCGAGAAFALKK